jgi:large subunit ribosomal protein L29
MDAVEIRELTDEELGEQIRRTEEELFRLRFRSAYEELENPSLLRTLRRELARMKTIQHERRLVAEAENDE